MAFLKLSQLSSRSSLAVLGGVILVAGVGIAVLGAQQQTNIRSQAHDGEGDDPVPAPAAPAGSTSYSPNITCTSTGQLCSPAYAIPIAANTAITAKYTSSQYHCSSIRIHFLVDGVEKHVSGWIGWKGAPAPFNTLPLETEAINLGSVGGGTHTLGLQAEGQVSGCNVGALGAWGGGTFVVETAPSTPSGTKLSLDLLLHGIGKAGDSVKPGAAGGGNMSPKHPERDLKVDLYDEQDQKIKSVKGKIKFNSQSGSFKGTIDIDDLATGTYVKVKFTQSLEKQIDGIKNVSSSSALPQQSLVTGDINNDGADSPDVLDYSILISCYGVATSSEDCTQDDKVQADLDDNNKVDQFDYNLFMRELGN